ncbi:hypothetical protein [Streptomyces variabilis]
MSMHGAGENPDSKVDVDQLIELATRLENVPKGTVKRALKEINYPARTQRINMYLGHATTALGTLVAGGSVIALVWLAHSMVQAQEAGYGVLLCGLPASSIAGIFVIRKAPNLRAFTSMSRQLRAAQPNQVPPARTAADPAANPADQTGSGV